LTQQVENKVMAGKIEKDLEKEIKQKEMQQ
jgi:hypothetical protein